MYRQHHILVARFKKYKYDGILFSIFSDTVVHCSAFWRQTGMKRLAICPSLIYIKIFGNAHT